MLRYIIGNKDDFTTAGIEITTERTSSTGLALKHIENLTDEQFETVRFDERFEFKSDEAVEEMLASPEWCSEIE